MCKGAVETLNTCRIAVAALFALAMIARLIRFLNDLALLVDLEASGISAAAVRASFHLSAFALTGILLL